MSRLPSIFISHGSPMHALQPGAAGAAWAALGKRIGTPKAILIASAHWETDIPALTGTPQPETIHDFYGFPAPLYQLRYPAPGDPALAQRARELLGQAGIPAAVDPERGLDHGAWSPLLYMYPKADAPVVQLSVQPGVDPRQHVEVGKQLRPLAGEGVLIVGSGHMTHNLRDWARGQGVAQPYAKNFQAWVRKLIEAHDYDTLAAYRTASPDGVRSHPTDEHFLPLFVALGAAPDQTRAERIYDDIESGVLAMDAYVFS